MSQASAAATAGELDFSRRSVYKNITPVRQRGLFKIFIGLYFRTPVPIQPMKAIGGMAGHIRFGARTGGAPVILGVLILFTGLFLSDSVMLGGEK